MTEEVFEQGEKIIQTFLKVGFAIKQSKVKAPAQEIWILGVKWQNRHHQTPMDVVNKTAALSPVSSRNEAQAFPGAVGFCKVEISEYNQIVGPLYHGTQKKNDFKWGPDHQQALEQMKQEIAHAGALGLTGQDVWS